MIRRSGLGWNEGGTLFGALASAYIGGCVEALVSFSEEGRDTWLFRFFLDPESGAVKF